MNKKYITLIAMVVFVVIGGLYNWQINPKTDSSIQTSFSTGEIVFAIVVMLFVYGFYFQRRMRKIKSARQLMSNETEQLQDLRAPFRSKKDYDDATQKNMNSFSLQEEEARQNKRGEAIISEYARGPKFIWNGEFLSSISQGKLIKFDGNHIIDFAGNKLFTWERNSLSIFAGNKIYKAFNGQISEFAGTVVYSYTDKSISKFAGVQLYSIKGELSVPEPILIIIAADLV